MNRNTVTAECLHGMCVACECENACACTCHLRDDWDDEDRSLLSEADADWMDPEVVE